MRSARERFEQLARRPDNAISLAEGALLISAEAQPRASVPAFVAKHLAHLDALAEEVRPQLPPRAGPQARLEALSAWLYGSAGFSGNRTDYYDLRNSYLDEVLARRMGIPITLAVVFIEVAARLGLHLHGVNFPGHFLLGAQDPAGLLIDPFSGAFTAQADWLERLPANVRERAPAFFAPAPAKVLLARLLRNLKQIHAEMGDAAAALACCDRILLLTPDVLEEWLERGLLYRQLDCFAEAARDVEHYLAALPPRGEAAQRARSLLADLQAQLARVN